MIVLRCTLLAFNKRIKVGLIYSLKTVVSHLKMKKSTIATVRKDWKGNRNHIQRYIVKNKLCKISFDLSKYRRYFV